MKIIFFDPSARVAFGGTASCAWDYIEKAVRAGAKDAFDIVNVHPYRHPSSLLPKPSAGSCPLVPAARAFRRKS